MRIGETLKRAAGLIIEFPDDHDDDLGMGSMGPRPTPAPMSSEPLIPISTPSPAAPTKTVEQIVRDAPGPNLDEIKVPVTTQTAIDDSGKVDFNTIYQMAQLTPAAFSAEQVLEIISSLPSDLPLESKRQTVKITLNAMTKTMGVSPETIVADASRKLAALAAYADGYSKQATQFGANAEAEIASLQAQVLAKQTAIEDAKKKQVEMVQACTAESDRLDDVLEFFSMDVPPSKYAPPGSP